MSDMTPDLPPHLLAKRKRQQDAEPLPDTPAASGATHSAHPDEPEKRRKTQHPDPTTTHPPRRVAGPALPPAPLDERPDFPPPQTENDSDSDSEDDFAPPLPGSSSFTTTHPLPNPSTATSSASPSSKPKRDDWMLLPPTQDDLAARLDPLQARPTKFAGKNAQKSSSAGDQDNSAWHETPEQKQQRLRDEMMGISSKSQQKPGAGGGGGGGRGDAARAAKMRKDEAAHRIVNETRGPSLMEQHERTKGPEAIDDDPSKRAFDREKDMGGKTISAVQKRQMLNKAAGFAGKFSGGSYL